MSSTIIKHLVITICSIMFLIGSCFAQDIAAKKSAAPSSPKKEYTGKCFLKISLGGGNLAMTPFFQDNTTGKKYILKERVPGEFALTDSPRPCRVTGYIKGNTIVYDTMK
jgi:hypothetical protein